MSTDYGELGKLEKVDIRSVWPTEDRHFTKWLSEQENLHRLADDLNLDLELHATEEQVGPFSADILCRSTFDDSWVVIENQFGRTDHDHLGKLLTYAAGLDGRTMIWIAELFTDEHRAAIDLLNESTGNEYNYFGVEIELLKIGNSNAAPRFNVVAQPNQWAKSVKRRAGANGELTETRRAQLGFWISFSEHMAQHSHIKCSKPRPDTWMSHTVGMAGVQFVSNYSTWNSLLENYSTGELRAELYLSPPNAKARYDLLHTNAESIEKEFGETLTWYNDPTVQACRVYVRKDIDFQNHDDWPAHRQWMQEKLELLHRTFVARIQTLNTDDWEPESDDPEI